MDCKAHRVDGLFEVKALYVEDEVPEPFFGAFATAVVDYAAFTGCQEIAVRAVTPGSWLKPVRGLLQ